jgi:hypothetical protein
MHGDSPYDPAEGDWQVLVTFFSPTEAYLLRGCLQAAGVPAVVADAHLVQTHTLLAPAVPVRLMVPERRLAQAQDVVAAFQRGDYALPDDDDNEAPPDGPTDKDLE